jgi:hypothetical protein
MFDENAASRAEKLLADVLFEKPRPAKPIVKFDGWGYELICPGCASNCLHHKYVTVYDVAKEDAPQMTRTRVSHGIVESSEVPNTNENPSSRRHGLAIGFWCECCPAKSELTIAQHKGNTLVEWRSATTRS